MKNKKYRQASFLLAIFVLLGLLSGGMAQGAEPAKASQFKDVGSDNSNLVYINYLGARGIMNGFADGAFHPAEGLSRAQAAVIISKALNLNASAIENSGFKDVPKSHWAAGYIAAADKAGYLKGFSDGRYRPDEPLTRAQGISLIMRLSKEKDTGAALPQLSDMASDHWAARAMAMALDAGMIATPANNAIQPDQPINRGDISRALAVLLVSDPKLSSCQLPSTLSVKSGEVSLSRGGQPSRSVSGTAQVGVGDTIETGNNAEAIINYPDGSSLLLKAGTKLTIKESQGRAYIKQDGKPGTAVDNLEVEVKIGKLFGGLSSLAQPVTTASAEKAATKTSFYSTARKRLASIAGVYDLLAAQTEPGTPWYKTAEHQKVKVKVDMPWGVAAIRGSFWQSAVNSNGSGSTNLLEGSAQVIAGGQTVSLSPGESSGGSSAGGPPSAPTPMTAAQISEWVQAQSWMMQTAQQMMENQGTLPATATNQAGVTPGAVSQTITSLTQSLTQAMNQAMNQAVTSTTSNSSGTSSSSNSDSSSSQGTITISGIPATCYIPNQFPGTSGAPVAGWVYQNLSISPANATVTCTESGTDVVDVTMAAGTGGNRSVAITCKADTASGTFFSGMETLTFKVTAPGYTATTKTVNVWALPPMAVNPSHVTNSYSTPLDIDVNSCSQLWTATDTISLQFIEAGSSKIAVDTSGNTVQPISPLSVASCNLHFQLNANLPIDQYEYVISVNGTPVAIAPLKVYNPAPSLTTMTMQPWAFAGYTRFAALNYTGADHYLFRFYPFDLPSPSLGETLDTSHWVAATVYSAVSPYNPGTVFPVQTGWYVQTAAVDDSNQVLAFSSHQILASEIGQTPTASFDSTPPSLVPGLWVSSTHLTGIASSLCSSGGYRWIFQPGSFATAGNIPTQGYSKNSLEYSGYLDINTDFNPGVLLYGVQTGYHIGFMGYDIDGCIKVFQDHILASSGEVAGTTPAPSFDVTFSTGGTNITTFTASSPPSGTTHYGYIYRSPSFAGSVSAPAAAALGSDASALPAYSCSIPGVSVGDHIWVFALNSSNQIVGFVDHTIITGEV